MIADVSNTLFYANANAASMDYVLPRIANNSAVYPPLSERDRFDVGVVFGPKEERKRTRAWSRVKTGL